MIWYIAVRIGMALEGARNKIINERKISRMFGQEMVAIDQVPLSEAAAKAGIPLGLAEWAVRRHKIRKRMLKWK